MSGIGDQDLVPVRSLDELRAGMTVVSRACSECGSTHCAILLKRHVAAGSVHGNTGRKCLAQFSWETAPAYQHRASKRSCFCLSFTEGRLYRLRDPGEHDGATRSKSAMERQA